MFKKLCLFICCILLFISSGVGVNAASSPVVYGDETEAGQDTEIKIPVNIKDNPGIMGFRITAEFDKEKISITNISSGELTENGLLSNSLQPGSEDSAVDVLWSGSEEVTDDGTLFYIYAKTAKKIKGDLEIKLSYAKEDTFNEDFKAVKLKCKTIRIEYDKKQSGASIEDNPEKDYLAGEIKDEIVSQMNDKKTADVITEAMKKNNVKDPSEMTEDQAKDTFKNVLSAMEAEDIDTTYIRELLNDAEKDGSVDTEEFYKELVGSLYGDASANLENDNHVDVPDSSAQKPKGHAALVGVIAAIVFIAAAFGAVIYRRRHS